MQQAVASGLACMWVVGLQAVQCGGETWTENPTLPPPQQVSWGKPGKVLIKEVLLAGLLLWPLKQVSLLLCPCPASTCFQCSSQVSSLNPIADDVLTTQNTLQLHAQLQNRMEVLVMAGMASQGLASLTFLLSSLLLAHIPTTLAF